MWGLSRPVALCPQERFTQMDVLILMTAAVCHDLDHPGYNNTYAGLLCSCS